MHMMEDEGYCPVCGVPSDPRPASLSRLLTDVCGHQKCCACLLRSPQRCQVCQSESGGSPMGWTVPFMGNDMHKSPRRSSTEGPGTSVVRSDLHKSAQQAAMKNRKEAEVVPSRRPACSSIERTESRSSTTMESETPEGSIDDSPSKKEEKLKTRHRKQTKPKRVLALPEDVNSLMDETVTEGDLSVQRFLDDAISNLERGLGIDMLQSIESESTVSDPDSNVDAVSVDTVRESGEEPDSVREDETEKPVNKEKPGTVYMCPYCDYETAVKARYMIHIYCHSDRKRLVCSHCPKPFKLIATIKSHYKLIHEIEPTEVEKKGWHEITKAELGLILELFQQKHGAQFFLKTASPNRDFRFKATKTTYHCALCGHVELSLKQRFQQHMMCNHSLIKPLKCPHCLSSFKLRSNAKSHFKRQHPDTVLTPELLAHWKKVETEAISAIMNDPSLVEIRTTLAEKSNGVSQSAVDKSVRSETSSLKDCDSSCSSQLEIPEPNQDLVVIQHAMDQLDGLADRREIVNRFTEESHGIPQVNGMAEMDLNITKDGSAGDEADTKHITAYVDIGTKSAEADVREADRSVDKQKRNSCSSYELQVRVFECLDCKFKCEEWGQYMEHIYEHEKRRIFQCCLCVRQHSFGTKSSLITHYRSAHKFTLSKDQEETWDRLKASYNEYMKSNKEKVPDSRKRSLPGVLQVEVDDRQVDTDDDDEQEGDVSKYYACTMCSFASPSEGPMCVHLRTSHWTQRPLACDHCNAVFNMVSRIKGHYRKVHDLVPSEEDLSRWQEIEQQMNAQMLVELAETCYIDAPKSPRLTSALSPTTPSHPKTLAVRERTQSEKSESGTSEEMVTSKKSRNVSPGHKPPRRSSRKTKMPGFYMEYDMIMDEDDEASRRQRRMAYEAAGLEEWTKSSPEIKLVKPRASPPKQTKAAPEAPCLVPPKTLPETPRVKPPLWDPLKFKKKLEEEEFMKGRNSTLQEPQLPMTAGLVKGAQIVDWKEDLAGQRRKVAQKLANFIVPMPFSEPSTSLPQTQGSTPAQAIQGDAQQPKTISVQEDKAETSAPICKNKVFTAMGSCQEGNEVKGQVASELVPKGSSEQRKVIPKSTNKELEKPDETGGTTRPSETRGNNLDNEAKTSESEVPLKVQNEKSKVEATVKSIEKSTTITGQRQTRGTVKQLTRKPGPLSKTLQKSRQLQTKPGLPSFRKPGPRSKTKNAYNDILGECEPKVVVRRLDVRRYSSHGEGEQLTVILKEDKKSIPDKGNRNVYNNENKRIQVGVTKILKSKRAKTSIGPSGVKLAAKLASKNKLSKSKSVDITNGVDISSGIGQSTPLRCTRVCKLCHFSSVTRTIMAHHLMGNHLEDKPLKCPECKTYFKLAQTLRQHMQASHDRDATDEEQTEWKRLEKVVSDRLLSEYCTNSIQSLNTGTEGMKRKLSTPDKQVTSPSRAKSQRMLQRTTSSPGFVRAKMSNTPEKIRTSLRESKNIRSRLRTRSITSDDGEKGTVKGKARTNSLPGKLEIPKDSVSNNVVKKKLGRPCKTPAPKKGRPPKTTEPRVLKQLEVNKRRLSQKSCIKSKLSERKDVKQKGLPVPGGKTRKDGEQSRTRKIKTTLTPPKPKQPLKAALEQKRKHAQISSSSGRSKSETFKEEAKSGVELKRTVRTKSKSKEASEAVNKQPGSGVQRTSLSEDNAKTTAAKSPHEKGSSPSASSGKSSKPPNKTPQDTPKRPRRTSSEGSQRGKPPVEGIRSPRRKSPGEGSKSPRGKSPAERSRSPRGKSPVEGNRSPRGKSPVEGTKSPRGKSPVERSRSPRGKSPVEGMRSAGQKALTEGSRSPGRKSPITGIEFSKGESAVEGSHRASQYKAPQESVCKQSEGYFPQGKCGPETALSSRPKSPLQAPESTDTAHAEANTSCNNVQVQSPVREGQVESKTEIPAFEHVLPRTSELVGKESSERNSAAVEININFHNEQSGTQMEMEVSGDIKVPETTADVPKDKAVHQENAESRTAHVQSINPSEAGSSENSRPVTVTKLPETDQSSTGHETQNICKRSEIEVSSLSPKTDEPRNIISGIDSKEQTCAEIPRQDSSGVEPGHKVLNVDGHDQPPCQSVGQELGLAKVAGKMDSKLSESESEKSESEISEQKDTSEQSMARTATRLGPQDSMCELNSVAQTDSETVNDRQETNQAVHADGGTSEYDFYVCRVCQYKNVDMTEMGTHLLLHMPHEGPVLCPNCDFRSSRAYMAHQHYEQKHGQSADEEQKSVWKKQETDMFIALVKEYCNFSRSPVKGENLRVPLLCKMCGKEWSQWWAFLQHVHGHEPYESILCPCCEESFGTLKQFWYHASKVHGAKTRVKCNECGRITQSLKQHYQHYRLSHSSKSTPSSVKDKEQHACHKCRGIFSDKSALQKHNRLFHSNIKKNVCKHCGKCYHFAREKRLHEAKCKTRTYCCSICRKTFECRSTFVKHKATHSGAKLHLCRFCKQAFFDGSTKNRHERLHTEEKRYMCHYCSRTSNRKDNMKKHMLMHKAGMRYNKT